MGVTALQAMEAEQRPAGCASFLYECHRVVSVDMDLIPSIERAWSTGLHSSSSLSSCDTQVDAPSSLTRMSSMASVGSDPATMAFRASSMPAYENHTSSEDTLARSLANCQVDVDCAAAAMEQLKTPSCDLEVDTTTDEFRMYKFKVELCKRESCPDWNKCPYAHAGEKAARRDPRIHYYRPEFCQGLRKNTCPNGDKCVHSHSVFETWLHPMKYRIQLCNKGLDCDREVCFFAHTEAELRHVPQIQDASPPQTHQAATSSSKKRGKTNQRTVRKPANKQTPSNHLQTSPGLDHSSDTRAASTPSQQLLEQFKILQQQASASQKAMEIYHAQRMYEAIALNNLLMQSGYIAGSPAALPAAALASQSACQTGAAAVPNHPLPASHVLALQMCLTAGNLPSASSFDPRTASKAGTTLNNHVLQDSHAMPTGLPEMQQQPALQEYYPFLSSKLFDNSLYTGGAQRFW